MKTLRRRRRIIGNSIEARLFLSEGVDGENAFLFSLYLKWMKICIPPGRERSGGRGLLLTIRTFTGVIFEYRAAGTHVPRIFPVVVGKPVLARVRPVF